MIILADTFAAARNGRRRRRQGVLHASEFCRPDAAASTTPPKCKQPADNSLHVGGSFSFGVLIFMPSLVAEHGVVRGTSLDIAGRPDRRRRR